jgi:hypothetical protein
MNIHKTNGNIYITSDELFLVLSADKNMLPAQYCETCKPKQDESSTTSQYLQ